MFQRSLGRSGIQVSGLGLGCWAIGGLSWKNDQPVGWGQVDDEESIRAIHRALDLGVTFFDTAAVYGCGHSERILGKALANRRHQVVIATKFGKVFDEETRRNLRDDPSPERIHEECEASLRRLNTDYIDLFQLHIKKVDTDNALALRDSLESLVATGKIRFYGWSTDSPDNARLFAEGIHCTAIQQLLNIFEGNDQTLAICEQFNLASINRSPLAMGLLTGKYSVDTKMSEEDVRSRRPAFQEDRGRRLEILDRVRDLLMQDGRSLVQGALGWIWARSPKTIPIPGFKTLTQVEENIGALHFGPLSDQQMSQIAELVE